MEHQFRRSLANLIFMLGIMGLAYLVCSNSVPTYVRFIAGGIGIAAGVIYGLLHYINRKGRYRGK